MPLTGRVASAAVLLVVGAGLAMLAVMVHYEFIKIYGDVCGTAFEGLTWGLTAGPSGLGLGLVAVVAMIGFMISTRRWMRLTAVAIPVLMLLGMFAVTPGGAGAEDGKPICFRSAVRDRGHGGAHGQRSS